MKRLLLILLLVFSTCLQAQVVPKMERIVHSSSDPLKIGTVSLRGIEYIAPIPTDNWLIFIPGTGERGTDVLLLEKPTAMPKLARDGRVYNYNIIAAQVTGDYTVWLKTVVPWLKSVKHAKVIGVTGMSLGGQWAYLCATRSDLKALPIDFISSIAGAPDPTIKPVCEFKNIPVYSVSGDKDKINTYTRNLDFYNLIQACGNHTAYYELVKLYNTAHDSWTPTYTQPDDGPFYKFIASNFPPVITVNIVTGTSEVIETSKDGQLISSEYWITIPSGRFKVSIQ